MGSRARVAGLVGQAVQGITLPALRDELDVSEGARLPDGQPSWTLHDPARHRFYRIDWMSFEILARWSLGDAKAIADSVSAATPLQIGAAHVLQVLDFLQQNQLLSTAGRHQAKQMAGMAAAAKGSLLKGALHHYLFFRVPLWRPDAWLARWLPIAQFAFNRGFALATVLALLAGAMMVMRESERFLNSLVDTFSLTGAASYAVALVAVKFIHELGHAFAAKRHGCRVPVMGVAFVLLWPMAYTDTNEAWRIADPRKRLQVASAGVLAELAVAAWATFAWPWLPEGGLKTAAFFLATTSWLTTLAVNLSPFMRFDGYFVLSDWLDLPNLHERSFALARWRLREILFATGERPPEDFPPHRRRLLIAFAWVVWIYRLVVFFGIALVVYQFFIKLVGILLFAIEVGWFIVRPLAGELAAWRTLLPRALRGRRGALRMTLWLCALALPVALLFVPLPARMVVAGVVRPAEYLVIRAPVGARLAAVNVRAGDAVRTGEPLLRLEQPDLQASRHLSLVREEWLRWQASSAGLREDTRSHLLSREGEWARAVADGKAVDEQIDSLLLRAPFPGIVPELAPDLVPGQWVAAREPLGMLVNPAAGFVAETFVDEAVLKQVREGGEARFVDAEGRAVRLTVAQIDRDATRQLPSGLYASAAGGPVSARRHDGVLVPEQSVYRVLLTPVYGTPWPGMAPGRFVNGTVAIRSDGVRIGWTYVERALSVLAREAGF